MPRYPHVDPVSHVKHPGNGFYKYVNEKWLDEHTIDPWSSETSAIQESDKENTDNLLALLDSLPKTVTTPPKTSKEHLSALLHVFRSRSPNAENDYMKLCLTDLFSNPTAFMGWLARHKISSVVSLIVEEEIKPPYFVRAALSPGNLTLPLEYYKQNKSDKNAPVWKAYVNYIYTLALEFNLPFLVNVIDAELKISTMLNDSDTQILRSVKGHSLKRWMPDFDWDAYMVRGWERQIWILESPDLLKRLLSWMCNSDQDTVAGLLAYHFIVAASPYLTNSAVKAASDRLFKKELLGIEHEQPKKYAFISLAKHILPDALCDLYASSRENDEGKRIINDIMKMAESIREATVDIMRETTVLSKKTISRAIEKIHRMKFFIGKGTDCDTHLDGVTYDPDSLLHTVMSIQEARVGVMMDLIGKPTKSGDYPCYVVNASYYTESNHLVIPWGILRWPFYAPVKDNDQLAYHYSTLGWNYGGTGTTIGHEIMHAFDLEGSQYSPRAVYKEWWTRKDRQRFKKKTRKVGKFYSGFVHYGKHLNGKRTLSEDWADLGGMKVCLRALKKDLMDASEDNRKVAYQSFFIAYAMGWRNLSKKKKLMHKLMTNVHTPAQDRVDRIVPHFQEWIDAFDVKETDELFLSKKDRLNTF